MSGFKFKRVKNKFRWENYFMALEFSEPSIQGFSEFIQLEDEKDIMYYYYTVKIFKKIEKWDKNDKEFMKWKLVSERKTYDFPSILELKWIVDFQLKDNTIINGQRIKYQNGEVRYSKVMATEGFACDDFYEITKVVDSEGNDLKYTVYCGTSFDTNGDLNSVGLRTPYVCRKDIEELLKCVSTFIQYSMDEHNKINKYYKDSFEIKNDKIYEYNFDGDNIDKGKLEAIYSIGDLLDIKTVVNNKEYDYNKVIISKIEDKKIILNNGDIINGEFIVYISNNPTDEMLKYDKNEIAQEFFNILSEEEKEEFKNSNADELLEKYKMAIIHRTWMCRDEHKFNIDYNGGSGVELVTPIVMEIINKIKVSK